MTLGACGPQSLRRAPWGRDSLENLPVGKVSYIHLSSPWKTMWKRTWLGWKTHFPQSSGDPGEGCRGHINNGRAMANALEASHLSLLQNRSMKTGFWPQGPCEGKTMLTFMAGPAVSVGLSIKAGTPNILVFNTWKSSICSWVNRGSKNENGTSQVIQKINGKAGRGI